MSKKVTGSEQNLIIPFQKIKPTPMEGMNRGFDERGGSAASKYNAMIFTK
jgi:hypothetical protein